MKDQAVMEGEIISPDEQYDPDLNAAFYAFTDAIEQEANGGGKIAVFQIPLDHRGMPRAKAMRTRLFETGIGQMTFEEICQTVVDDYMALGETTVIQLMGTRDGRRGVQFNKQIRLRKSNRAEEKPQASVGGELATILKVMQENQARDRAEMRNLLATLLENRGPQRDPMEFGFAMAEKLTALASALNRPAAAPSMIPGVPSGSPVSGMMELFTMMKMMKEFTGENAKEPNEENVGAIFKSIADMAKPLLAAHHASAQAVAMREQRLLLENKGDSVKAPPVPPAETPTPETAREVPSSAVNSDPPPVRPPAQESNETKLLAQLREVVPVLVEFAEKDANVTEVAELALSTMPDDETANKTLVALLQDENFFAKLVALDERVGSHAKWFESLRVALLEEFKDDTEATS